MATSRRGTGNRGTAGRRRRRTPEEARRLILDTAEARLRAGGPAALRLKEIARDAGISHPTILHHFESREGLVQALLMRGMDRLESALEAVVETSPPTEEAVRAATERIFATLCDTGHARLLAGRALEGGGPEPDDDAPVLRPLADLVHARRVAVHGENGSRPVSRADSDFLMWLTAAATLGDAIFGPYITRWLGREAETEERDVFRARFARLLFEQLLETGDGDLGSSRGPDRP